MLLIISITKIILVAVIVHQPWHTSSLKWKRKYIKFIRYIYKGCYYTKNNGLIAFTVIYLLRWKERRKGESRIQKSLILFMYSRCPLEALKIYIFFVWPPCHQKRKFVWVPIFGFSLLTLLFSLIGAFICPFEEQQSEASWTVVILKHNL